MSAGSASKVHVHTITDDCSLTGVFMLGCEGSSYVMYISYEWDEYEVLTLELIAMLSYIIGCYWDYISKQGSHTHQNLQLLFLRGGLLAHGSQPGRLAGLPWTLYSWEGVNWYILKV